MKKNSLLVNVFGIILLSILLIISLFSIFEPTNFMGISNWLSPFRLIGSGIAIWIILDWTIHFLKNHPNFSKNIQLILIIGLIGIQVYVAINLIDYGRADSFYVRNQAYLLAHFSKHWMNYFEIYPNNVFCALWISLLIKLSLIFHFQSPWMLINVIQFGWLDLGLCASIFLLKKWNKPYLTPILILIWIFTAPFYGYALFVYTDIWVLPIPIMVAALLEIQLPSRIEWVKYIFISGLLIFAAKMKGNFWILVIAMVLGLIIMGINKGDYSQLRKFLIALIPILFIFSIGTTTIQKMQNYHSTNKALPVTHWIAMSSDPNTHGDYINKQTLKEINLPSKKIRNQTDIKIIVNNFKKMKFSGFIKHCAAKLQLLASSGTFGFERLTQQWQRAPQWFYKFQSQLRIRIANISQIEYLVLLCGTIISLITVPLNNTQVILEIFMIGIITFHSVLWESEERYGLPLLPILILFGILGIDACASKIKSSSNSLLKFGKGLLIGIFIILIGKAINNLPSNSSGYVTGQNIGSYLANEQLKIAPQGKLTTKIQLPIKAQKLILFPSDSNQKINVRITQGQHLIATINSTAQLQKINISRAHPGDLQIKINNSASKAINFEVGRAAYPIASSSIKNHPHTYLQYQIKQ